MATIVTAFYPLERSKHGVHKYMEWIRLFCAIPRPMVIVTAPALVDTFQQLRNDISGGTHIISREFSDFSLTTPARMEMWQDQWKIDSEASYHNPELYAVWGLKQECVAAAIAANPFGHDWFVWCDIGIQRDPSLQSYYATFPDTVPRLCAPGTIHFLEVTRIPDSLAARRGEVPMPYPPPNVTLGGGCIAGDRAAWATFSAGYTAMLDRFLARGWFAGKDQIVYLAMLMERTMPFRLFSAIRFGDGARGDPWMSFPVILGGQAPAIVDARFEEPAGSGVSQ